MALNPPKVRIAGIEQNPDEVVGIKIAGNTGTGKSLFMTKLAVDVSRIGDPSIHLDVSGNLAEILRWNGCRDVMVFDPVMEGGLGIDLGPFLRSPADCQRLAGKLAPEIKNDPNPFWRNILVTIFYYVLRIIQHHNRGETVHLADVVRLAKNRNLSCLLARGIGDIRDPFADITHHELLSNVLATLNVHLMEMEVVSALLLHCPRHLDFTDPDGTIVIRWSDRFRDVLRPLLTFVFDSIIEYRLAFGAPGRLWLFLDEYPSFGRIDSLVQACRRGRKHGCKIVLAFQEIGGLYDLYKSHDGADELMGLCAHSVFTRAGSPQMGKWASEYGGTPTALLDVWPHRASERRGPNREYRDDYNFTPDEIRRLPLPDYEQDRIYAMVDFPNFTGTVEAPWRSEIIGVPKPTLTPRRADQMMIPPLRIDDLHRLGMPLDPEIIASLTP